MNLTVPESAQNPPVEAAPEAAPEAQQSAGEPYAGWRRFLADFWLWLEALYHAVQAGWLLLGRQYVTVELREMAYAGLPALRALDWALAIVAGVAAVLCVRSAVLLRRRCSAGPKLLCGTYILLLAGQLGFAAGRWFIVGLTPLTASTLGPSAVYLALLLVSCSDNRRRRG